MMQLYGRDPRRGGAGLQGVAGMRHVKLDESATQAVKQASHQQGLRVGRAKECLEEWAWDAQALDLLLNPNVLPKYLLVSPSSLRLEG